MREIKHSFDSIVTNIGVKNVITNRMLLEVNESILLWRSNINFVNCNNDDQSTVGERHSGT